jgi:hypothetical protein
VRSHATRTFPFPRRVAPWFCGKRSTLFCNEGARNAGCPMHPRPRVQ